MKVIQKRYIRYFKLCLISPIFEIIINLTYIVSFLVIAIVYTNMGNNYTNYEVYDIASKYLNKSKFEKVTTPNQFKNYLINLVTKLYTYNPNTEYLPFFIPSGTIELRSFSNNGSECSDNVDYGINCEKNYTCIMSNLYNFYKQKCGQPYKSSSSTTNVGDEDFENENEEEEEEFSEKQKGGALKFFVAKFEGQYSYYDILNDGYYLELSIDNLQNNIQYINLMLYNKNLKFIVIQINFYVPANENTVNAVIGIEMTNYFTNIKHVFNVSVYQIYDTKHVLFLTFFIFYIISVCLFIIKLIFEINVKLIWSIHIFEFFNSIADICAIIFTIFSLSAAKDTTFTGKKKFVNHVIYIYLRKYCIMIYTLVIVFVPFRMISIFSWMKSLSLPFTKYIVIIFRIIPGLLIMGLFFGLILLMFAMSNYILFKECIEQYSSFYNAFLSLFNINFLQILSDKKNSKVYHSLSSDEYVLIISIFQNTCLYVILALIIGTCCYLYKQSSKLENEKNENEVLLKIKSIEEKLEQEGEKEDYDLKHLKKQILWLNLSNKNDIFNNYMAKSSLLLFKTSSQLISVLKFLFAIKPKLQFKKLHNKFGIIIEVKNEKMKLKESELDQIYTLIDWLTFVGCKIPVTLFSQINLEKTFKMKLHSIYNNIRFINDQSEIDNFIVDIQSDNICILENNFEILKKNQDINNNFNINENLNSNNNNNNNDSSSFYSINQGGSKKKTNRSLVRSNTKTKSKKKLGLLTLSDKEKGDNLLLSTQREINNKKNIFKKESEESESENSFIK